MVSQNKVLAALELACHVSRRDGNWATVEEIRAFAGEANVLPVHINNAYLDVLANEGRIQRRSVYHNVWDVDPNNWQYRPINFVHGQQV